MLFQQKRRRFYADLERIEGGGGIQQVLNDATFRPRFPGDRPRLILEAIKLPELPGVASFFVPGETLRLPAEFRMVWRTRSILRGMD